MVVFFLLGPFSNEPVSFATLMTEELLALNPAQSPVVDAVSGAGTFIKKTNLWTL
jgi:hypothetical protein